MCSYRQMVSEHIRIRNCDTFSGYYLNAPATFLASPCLYGETSCVPVTFNLGMTSYLLE